MNFILDVFLAFAVVALFIVFACKCFSKHDFKGNLLGANLIVDTAFFLAYLINLFSMDETVMKFMCSLEHALLDWMVLFLLYFVYAMEDRKVKKEIRYLLHGILIIDSCILLSNPVNGFTAGYELKTGIHYGSFVFKPNLFFFVHVALCVSMGLFIMFTIVNVYIKSSRYYRTKYTAFIVVAVCIVVLNASLISTGVVNQDLAKVLFGFGNVVLYFTTYNFSPDKLIKMLHEYIDDNISDATIIYDCNDRILKQNAMARKLFEGTEIDTIEKLTGLFGEFEDGKKKVCTINDFYYEVACNRIFDNRGIYVATTVIFHDYSEEKRALAREHHAATFDKLTNSFNRLGLFEAVPKFFESNDKLRGYALMVSGICNFKGINGLYGTQVGDRILKAIAKKLHDYHHEFPMIYGRTAEGKFTCILPFEHIDSIVNALGCFEIEADDNLSARVEMASGFVVIKDYEKPIDYYYEQALLALARCKQRTGLPMLEYTEEMTKEHNRKLMLTSEMHSALENHEFFIEIQPQIDIKNQRVSGAEALARWNSPVLGRVSPGEFIPLFERNGFITVLDKYIWEEAAATIKRLSDEKLYDGPISVNVSQIDINCFDVVEEFRAIVKKYDIPADKLHIEITESACVKNRDTLAETMKKLRENGFVVEIDDFGSGYSSLNALMHLPFDVVKLDMEFMRNNIRDEKSDVIINAMAEMIHDLKAQIIVEGVETEDNLKSVRFFNGDVVQGYYYSRPIPVDDFVNFANNFK